MYQTIGKIILLKADVYDGDFFIEVQQARHLIARN